MSDLGAYFCVVAGVVVAVILPSMKAYIGEEFPQVAGPRIPPWVKRYIVLGVFGLIVGGLSLAIWKSMNRTEELSWFTAFLLGFGWESALEKFWRPKP